MEIRKACLEDIENNLLNLYQELEDFLRIPFIKDLYFLYSTKIIYTN